MAVIFTVLRPLDDPTYLGWEIQEDMEAVLAAHRFPLDKKTGKQKTTLAKNQAFTHLFRHIRVYIAALSADTAVATK